MTTTVVPASSRDPYRVSSRLGAVAEDLCYLATLLVWGAVLVRDTVGDCA